MLKKTAVIAAVAGAAYVLWQKAAYEREEREIWAEVSASFGEFPDHEARRNPVRYR